MTRDLCFRPAAATTPTVPTPVLPGCLHISVERARCSQYGFNTLQAAAASRKVLGYCHCKTS